MKKIISLVMVLTMCTLVFSACGSKDNGSKEEKKVLSMATNAEFPPYEYMEGEEIVGIDVEIAQAIADKLGMELKIDNINFDSIIPAVTSGKDDIGIAGITVDEKRKRV